MRAAAAALIAAVGVAAALLPDRRPRLGQLHRRGPLRPAPAALGAAPGPAHSAHEPLPSLPGLRTPRHGSADIAREPGLRLVGGVVPGLSTSSAIEFLDVRPLRR
jgi:hypothetical protein